MEALRAVAVFAYGVCMLIAVMAVPIVMWAIIIGVVQAIVG